MTENQINEAVRNYRELLEKLAGDFSVEAVQTVLSQPELARDQVEVLRRHIEAVSHFIIRRVSVNRTRTAQKALDATCRTPYTDPEVVAAMPKGEDDEVEVVFFKPDLSERNGYLSDSDLETEYEMRGLKPVDPFSLAAVNEIEHTFADNVPHGTHWRGVGGKWCFAAFGRWSGERDVSVSSHGRGWNDHWWFAGVRK